MRICVISNSHAASLKDGWDAVRSLVPQVELTFFAAPNRLMASLEADHQENKLHTDNQTIKKMLSLTSGGLDVIDINHYDAFLVYGLFLSVPRLDRKYSSALKAACISDSVKESINHRLVNDLCQMTKAPVYYSPNPLLSNSILNNAVEYSDCYHNYSVICEWIEKHYGHNNAILVKQIEQTMGHYLTTLKAYSKGSVRLKLTKESIAHIDHDVMHMNAEYGAQFMKMFLLEKVTQQMDVFTKAA